MNPITLFEQWFTEEKNQNNRKLSNACCLSTVGLDGYPNARFVSLKEIVEDSFVVTGSLSSRKGKEIENHKKAALTFWWTSSERQVRIQGDVTKISQAQAKTYFEQRNRDSKIVAAIFAQGEEIQSVLQLKEQFEAQKTELENKDIKLPENWSGISIKPIRIEFMEFKNSRLHERILYEHIENRWKSTLLQP